MSGIYDLTLAPGATERIPVVGVLAKIVSAPAGPVSLRIDSGDTYNSLVEGQGCMKPSGFSFVVVGNKATIAQTIQVFIGGDDFVDTRVTGAVYIIDGGAQKAAMNKSFIASRTAAADAANISVVAISAEGKTCAVRGLILQSASASSVLMGYGTAPGTATVTPNALTNRNVGAAGSTCATRLGVQVAGTPTGAELPGWVPFMRVYLQANLPYEIRFDTPMLISGTQLIAVNGQQINRDISIIVNADELT